MSIPSAAMATSETASSDDVFTTSPDEGQVQSWVEFSTDEEDLVIRMYKLVGERWDLIAGRIPGRTPAECKKYWLSKKKC